MVPETPSGSPAWVAGTQGLEPARAVHEQEAGSRSTARTHPGIDTGWVA